MSMPRRRVNWGGVAPFMPTITGKLIPTAVEGSWKQTKQENPWTLTSSSYTVVATLIKFHGVFILGIINNFCVICFGNCKKNTYCKHENQIKPLNSPTALAFSVFFNTVFYSRL